MHGRKYRGFTIVELLIVIVIIGILATIVIVAYNGITDRANHAKIQHDVYQISQASIIARTMENKQLAQITGQPAGVGGPMVSCGNKPAGTDFATLPKSDSCWVDYIKSLDSISQASGVNIRGIVDPWGRPYFIATLEYNRCVPDRIAAWSRPFNGGQTPMNGTYVDLPMFDPGVCE